MPQPPFVHPRFFGRRLPAVLFLMTLATVAGCGGGGSSDVTPPPSQPQVRAVVLDSTSRTLLVGQSVRLTVTLDADPGASVAVTWTSASAAVATVATDGTVTALAPGQTTIRATSVQTPTISGTTLLTVQQPPPAITSLTASPASMSLAVVATALANATVQQPAGAPAATVTYATSNPAVVTVTGSGTSATVRAVAVGSAMITVTAVAPGSVSFSAASISSPIAVTVTGGGGGTGLGLGFGAEQFALINAGSFQMGSTNGRPEERPVRMVTISSFRMQRTEVTQAQWRQVMQGTGFENPSFHNTCGDTCPVERVSWNDIQQFLTRLNQQDPGKNYRLPTEAEWEFAARAGTTGDYGGNGVLNDMGWWRGNSSNRTHPAAQKLANDWGLFDMHGNLWEWVDDWFGAYPSTSQTNPTGPTIGSFRATRGGSSFDPENDARSAIRSNNAPNIRVYYRGFRLARTP